MNTASDYSEKLKDPRWQRLRLHVMNLWKWKCGICQSEDKTLHVHHLEYRRDAEPWEYENKELITLCEACHELARCLSCREPPRNQDDEHP